MALSLYRHLPGFEAWLDPNSCPPPLSLEQGLVFPLPTWACLGFTWIKGTTMEWQHSHGILRLWLWQGASWYYHEQSQANKLEWPSEMLLSSPLSNQHPTSEAKSRISIHVQGYQSDLSELHWGFGNPVVALLVFHQLPYGVDYIQIYVPDLEASVPDSRNCPHCV